MEGSHFGVMLSPLGEEQLAETLRLYVRSSSVGMYLNCERVDPNGSMFHLVAESNGSCPDVGPVDLLLPHAFVKLVVSSPRRNPIGFLEAPVSDDASQDA